MFAKFANYLLTILLAIFFIGGGRVCGCEILEWVGVNVHQHLDDDHDHHHEHDHDCEHNGSESSENDCCDQAFKKLDMDTSRVISVPELLINSGASITPFFTCLVTTLQQAFEPDSCARWKYPPPDLPLLTLSGIQRFTI